jgi:O-antigen/teichoic acid export membrane protein
MNSEMGRGSVTALILRSLALLMSFVTVLFISRNFSAKELGVFTLVQSVLMIMISIGRFGMHQSMIKRVAVNKAKNNVIGIRKDYSNALFVSIGVSLLIVFAYLLVMPILGDRFLPDLQGSMYLFAIAGSVIILVWRDINVASLRGLKAISISVFLEQASVHLFTLIFLLVIYFAIEPEGAILNSYFLAILSAFLISQWFWYRESNKLDHTQGQADFSRRDLINLSFPMLLSSSLLMLNQWMDSLMLGYFLNEEEVGLYNVALRISNLVMIPLFAVNAVAAPKFAEDYSKDGRTSLQGTVSQASKMIFLLSIPLVVVLGIGGEFALSIFGEEYTASYLPLLILLIGQAVNVSAGSVMNLLQMTGYEKLGNRIVLASTVTNIVLNVLLIPLYGAIGAAIATSASLVMWNVLGIIYVWKKLKVRSFYWPFRS